MSFHKSESQRFIFQAAVSREAIGDHASAAARKAFRDEITLAVDHCLRVDGEFDRWLAGDGSWVKE